MLLFSEIKKSLPPSNTCCNVSLIREKFIAQNISIIVLDDDPTGTQTIFDVPVLTSWGEKEITHELELKTPLFFILTNSRSLPTRDAEKLALEIGKNCQSASEKTKRKVVVISRGDSTLRGHYPNEVDALAVGLGITNCPQILIPAFFQGGRVTINDVHYVCDNDKLIPAGESQFAKDSTFGYRFSDLKMYVEEKSQGRISAHQVKSIGLSDIRIGGPSRIKTSLSELKNNNVCLVNAAEQSDLNVFSAAFYNLLEDGFRPFLLRTAASVIPSLAGVNLKPELNKNDLLSSGKGGFVIVGSYVPKTNEQLTTLQNKFAAQYIEIDVEKVLDSKTALKEITRVSNEININLNKNKWVVAYTSRKIIKGKSGNESLAIVNEISNGVVEIVKNIKEKPAYFVAKGGITSSHILTRSFKTKKAVVLGQIIPGVPVWKLSNSERFENMIFMSFPGNTGNNDALLNLVEKLC